MSNKQLFRYIYSCVDESATVYEWRDEDEAAPTVCKNDHSHTLVANSVRIDTTQSPNVYKVKEESIPTGENFKTETIVISTPASSSATVEKSWKYPVGVLSMCYVSDSTNLGDNLEMEIAPDTTIGVVSSPVGIGDTVISVSSTVLEYTMKGYYLKISDGTNTDDLGIVLDVDKNAGTVTVDAPTTNAFAAGVSAIIQTIKMVENYEIGPPFEYTVGDSKIGASHVPANTVVRARYINNGLVEKKLVVKIEYLY